ncbi:hypothetical protein BCR35DRAFT_307973 [Leucosporidium creatinivorum]|uniref:Myb-like domain-containing protein n=1 Tax=Leucosporidium creatinivorum TaxID=106004 RepID=A0A1Y2ECV2_9BASI|nr:hypothetical protein BCR35DRAFT_307973 [Leucosporidium creatinivorum]
MALTGCDPNSYTTEELEKLGRLRSKYEPDKEDWDAIAKRMAPRSAGSLKARAKKEDKAAARVIRRKESAARRAARKAARTASSREAKAKPARAKAPSPVPDFKPVLAADSSLTLQPEAKDAGAGVQAKVSPIGGDKAPSPKKKKGKKKAVQLEMLDLTMDDDKDDEKPDIKNLEVGLSPSVELQILQIRTEAAQQKLKIENEALARENALLRGLVGREKR